MPNVCEQIALEYQSIKTLKKRFDLEYQRAEETGDFAKVKEFRAQLERKRETLSQKLWAFESLPTRELERRYEWQRDTLQRLRLLETLGNGELGIKAIDGKEYRYPTLAEVRRSMMAHKEVLKPKMEQGFKIPIVVPFGMKIDNVIEKYRQVILKHHKEGKLLATKNNPSDPDEPLALDETTPVWVWDEYLNADVSGELVYDPEKLPSTRDESDAAKRKALSKGKTKKQILEQEGAFRLVFLEDLPNIPRSGKGALISGRKQPEAGQTAQQYLEDMQKNSQYASESGLTPEDQILYAILHLEETNRVIDDYQGRGSISYQTGAYFPASGHVPRAYWARDARRAHLGWNAPNGSVAHLGVRGAVRVPLLKI